MFHNSSEATLGVVIRNHEREVMAALSNKKKTLPPSITQLELLATRQAALFVQEVGLHSSILEGDSEIVGDMFQYAFGHIIQDTLVYVNSLQSFLVFLISIGKVILSPMPWIRKLDLVLL